MRPTTETGNNAAAPWARRGVVSVAILLAAMVLLPGTGTLSGKKQGKRVDVAANTDDLLIVDCLLPGRVRRLGRNATYVEPRRPARLAAVECELRGGEYTAYDRASLATSLSIWREQAEAGDPQAQTYVGEMFEKGLGVPPDYAAAAVWYRRAAEQGFASAQINLGHLYEKGLGVERDPKTALRWYRAASGLPEAVALESPGGGEDAEELRRLRRQTRVLEEQARELADRVEHLEAEARKSQVELEAARERERDLVDELSEREQRLDELERVEETATDIDREEISRLKTDLTAKQSELDRHRARVMLLEGTVGSLERQLEDAALLEQQLDEQKELVAEVRRDREEIALELTAVGTQLDERRQEIAALESRLEAAGRELEEHRAGQAESELSANRIAELEGQLASSQVELESRRDEILELESTSRRYREQLDALELAREQEEQRKQFELAAGNIAGPTIELIDPPVLRTRGIEVVRASARERVLVGRIDAPAGLLSFLVNGNDRQEDLDTRGLFKVRVAVSDAPTRVELVAVDLQGKRASLELELVSSEAPEMERAEAERRAPSLDFGRYHAIVVGNNDYEHFNDLQTAVNDARAIARVLEKRYGFTTRLLQNASRHEILTALNEAARDLTEKDNLLIYYAGHGELLSQIQKGYWLPVDAERDNPANWISTSTITDYLGYIPAKHILVVADSCYSGSLTRSALARLEAGMTDEARNEWLKKMIDKKCRTALTSGGLQPVLDAGGGEHSVFAKALMDVLSANSEVLAGRRLYDQISARVAYAAEAMGMDQVPEYAPIRYSQHESGDFFFVPDK